MAALEGRGGWFWEGVQKIWSNNTFLSLFMFSIIGGVGMFVPVVMVVERGDATGVFGHFQILVSYSQFRYIVFCNI
jgi:hypothetical protein